MALHQNSNENNKHTPKGFTSAPNMGKILRDENGLSTYVPETTLPAALNFVNGAVAPPTEVLNQVYIIVDTGGGTVHPNWDGLNYNTWCRFNGAIWIGYTPTNGDICYDATALKYKIFETTAWVDFGVSGGGGGGNTIYTADDTLTGDRILNLGGNNLTFKNTSSTIPSVTLENTNTNHNAILINKSGALVAGEKSNIEFKVSGFFSSKIENIWHGASDISLTLGTLAHLETFRIRNGKVGIKQISPSYDLDVAGEIHSSLSGDAFTGLILENTSANHTALRINKTGSLVAGEKASIDFNVSGYFSSRIQNVWHGSNDMSLIFGTLAHLETFRIRNGKTIANGSNVIGSEGVSLQDDTLIKGSDTSASTTGFKVTDSANTSLLEVKNNGVINASNLPTSATGLSSGDIWNNGGVLNIV